VPPSESEWKRRQEENARKQQEQFRNQSQKQEQEHQARSAHSMGKDGVVKAWNQYEQAWNTLKDHERLYFRIIPWPIMTPPRTSEDLTPNAIGNFVLSPHHSQSKSNRDRLKEQLLRWHPDRFESKWLSKVVVDEKEAVRRAAGAVVRGLNELMSRESSSPFA